MILHANFRLWIYTAGVYILLSLNQPVVGQNLENPGKALSISGGLGGNFSYYDMNGIPARRSPYGYSVFGNINLRVYGWNLPFSIAINQQGSRFSQPFRQIGVSPHYKWAKLHLGYRTMQFSEFTLNGATFLGVGTELTPGKFRIKAMIGRFRNAREEAGELYRIPQFERNGYALSAGYGRETYIDLVFFKASDKPNSIANPDSIKGLRQPEANTAVGIKGNFQLARQKLNLSYDLGASAYTRNLFAEALDDAANLTNRFQKLIDVNRSSNVAGAALTALRYNSGKYNAGIEYRYVQPGYQTLGANYLLSDLEMFTFNVGGMFFKNKFGVQATYGRQNNNLSNRNFATTGRNIGSVNLNWRASQKLNVNASYSNFSIYQTLILDSLFADSIVIDQTNHQVNAAFTYIVMGDLKTHTYSLNANFQDLSDRRETTEFSAATKMSNLNFTYGLRFNQKSINLRASLGYQNFISNRIDRKRFSISFGENFDLFNSKLSLRLSQNYIYSVTTNRNNDNIFVAQIYLDYKISNKHTLSCNSSLTSRQGHNKFNEARMGIGYRMRF